MNDKSHAVDASTQDFGTMMVCAVRYSLGRRTYMPGLVIGYIKPLLPVIDNTALAVIERDILEKGTLPTGIKPYGDDCDYREWMGFLADVQAEIQRRKEATL